ncbi:Synaptogyrin-3 [Dryobates pubescens]|uniref:Synaptogyrin-3 n=1 Tax=Dryobates pubescens TaxID=118200 RepID=A0A093I3P2_DRYPU|nr:Synaptogyrin-3 [Dryobates pubescens]
MEGASFGAGRAGGAIDPVDFVKQPQTILRVTTWVRNGRSRPGNGGAGLGTGCAVGSARCKVRCLCSMQLLLQGAVSVARCSARAVPGRCATPVSAGVGRGSPELSSLAGFLSFLWFVAFCFLANQWQRTTMSRGAWQGADAARAAITFSFFSIIVWVALALKALQRYRLGTDMSLFATEQLAADAGVPYPGYPGGSGVESTDTYQSPPFTDTLEPNPKGYQVPAY